MARVTVEDCLKNVKNRFELVLVASVRARQLMLSGVNPTVSWNNDKATVVALREIASGNIKASILDEPSVHVTEKIPAFELPAMKFTDNDSDSSEEIEDELVVVDQSANDEDFNEYEDRKNEDSEEEE